MDNPESEQALQDLDRQSRFMEHWDWDQLSRSWTPATWVALLVWEDIWDLDPPCLSSLKWDLDQISQYWTVYIWVAT